MIEYYYEGISREGEKIKGYLEAENETDIRIQLRTKKIRPIKIKEKTSFFKNKKIKTLPKKLLEKDKNIFIQEFLVMLKSDLSIIQALEILSSEGPNDTLMQVASSLVNYMESGMTFSQALARFPNYFDNMFLNIIASGEIRGNLNKVIELWQKQSEVEDRFNHIVKKTVSYPLIISGIFFTSFLIVVFGITPVFEKIYRTYEVKLPAVLLTLTTVGEIVSYNLFSLFFLFLILICSAYFVISKRDKNNFFSKLLLELPFFSNFFKKVYSLKVISTIQTVLKCGISLPRALELAAEKINNYKYEIVLLKAREAAKKKEPIAQILAQSKLFRNMTSQIIAVGETMNNLEEMLDELMLFSGKELENTCNKISSIIEPMFLLSGGIIIGAILVSYFIPIISILENIK